MKQIALQQKYCLDSRFLIEMDFQRLFKRKEGPAPAMGGDSIRDTLYERDVLIYEGELLDGKSPASLKWGNVGGTISLKADKILGILEGRTRIKAAVLQELYPGLFEKAPNPGTEYSIPLQAVVMQLEDIFAGIASEETELEGFDTPFGQLAREDETRFKEKPTDQPEVGPLAAPKLFLPQETPSKPAPKGQDQSAVLGKITADTAAPQQKEEKLFDQEDRESGKPTGSDIIQSEGENHPPRAEQPKPGSEEFFPTFELRTGGPALSSGTGKRQDRNLRREGLEYLQELYLTDESLDGPNVADLILRLPRVAGVVILLSDGAVLGGALSGGLSEALLGVAPDFVKHLLGFTTNMQGGPAKFATFSGDQGHLSLTIGGDVLILVGHERKNLPPGLRERLVATAQALNMIYGSQSS
jgi:hypothetical protein